MLNPSHPFQIGRSSLKLFFLSQRTSALADGSLASSQKRDKEIIKNPRGLSTPRRDFFSRTRRKLSDRLAFPQGVPRRKRIKSLSNPRGPVNPRRELFFRGARPDPRGPFRCFLWSYPRRKRVKNLSNPGTGVNTLFSIRRKFFANFASDPVTTASGVISF